MLDVWDVLFLFFVIPVISVELILFVIILTPREWVIHRYTIYCIDTIGKLIRIAKQSLKPTQYQHDNQYYLCPDDSICTRRDEMRELFRDGFSSCTTHFAYIVANGNQKMASIHSSLVESDGCHIVKRVIVFTDRDELERIIFSRYVVQEYDETELRRGIEMFKIASNYGRKEMDHIFVERLDHVSGYACISTRSGGFS